MTDMRDVFDAREYLQRYFVAPDEEDELSLKFWIDQIDQLPQGVRALEYGGGPALYSALTLARKASTIHFSDYVPANLAEVRRWLARAAGAHDWRPYVRRILELEHQPHDEAAVRAREDALRRQLTHISEGDARSAAMLDDARPPYDVIAAHHCLDVAARDVSDFERMVRRLSDMLALGGLFLVSITTGTTQYTVDGTVFACLDLTLDQVRAALVAADIDPGRIFHTGIPVRHEEYSAMQLAAGWKKH